METTEQVFSHNLLNVLDSMMQTCPLADEPAKVLFSTACEVARSLLTESDDVQPVQVPTPAAKVLARGVILLGYTAEHLGNNDVKDNLLDIIFTANHTFAVAALKEMRVCIDNPSLRFSFSNLLTAVPLDRKFEQN